MDIETTGLDPLAKTAEILEIYIKIMNKGKKIKEYYLQYNGDNWELTKNIHKIPKEEIEFKPKFKDSPEDKALIKALFKRCWDPNDDMIFMAQYAPFEYHWFLEHLDFSFEERLAMEKVRTCDTRFIAKNLFPLESHSLINMCEKYNIGFPKGQHDFHRADQDVNAMWDLFETMLKDIPIESMEDFDPNNYSFDFNMAHDDENNADKK